MGAGMGKNPDRGRTQIREEARWCGQRAAKSLGLPLLLPAGGVPRTDFSTAIPPPIACPFGQSAARTGKVSYTFSSSLPALGLSTASHTKVSPVPACCTPSHVMLFWDPAMVFLACPFLDMQAEALLSVC